jgi:hypothetical protein
MGKKLACCIAALLPATILVLAALWLSVATSALANGGTRYVAPPPDGDDSSNDCTNPASPCETVQHAVEVASAGETIKVATGSYTDTHTVAALGGPVVVELTKTVTLRGGYDTSFTEPSDPGAHPTILDAQGAARVLYVSGAAPVIEGFTVTGGQTSASGGGVYLSAASPTLRGNVITDNVSNGDGGGIWISGGAAIIEGNVIISNTADWGGGLRIINDADVLVAGNLIVDNLAELSGGGIHLESHTSVTPHIVRNTFRHNIANSQGGGLNAVTAHARVENNFFLDNEATEGAGVFIESEPANPVSTTLVHNTWVGGSAKDEAVRVRGNVEASVVNNIIADFGIGITNTTPASGTVSADFTLFDNTGTKYGSGVVSTNEVSGAPEFVNVGEGDYHITTRSGAFDAAVDLGVSTDIDGDRRPSGEAPDVGADEVPPWFFVPLVLKGY